VGYKYSEGDILELMAMFSIRMCEEELSDENIALAKREAKKFLIKRNKHIKYENTNSKSIYRLRKQ
jgi:hypothetical protein